MTRWQGTILLVVVLSVMTSPFVATAGGAGHAGVLASTDLTPGERAALAQSFNDTLLVGDSFAITVTLVGDALRTDPDASSSRPDFDGVTYLPAGEYIDVDVEMTAPYTGAFAVCVYPWVVDSRFPDDFACSDVYVYQPGDYDFFSFPVFLDPAYADSQHQFYVYVWEQTPAGFQEVDWVWFTVAVDEDEVVTVTTPRKTVDPPVTTTTPPPTTTTTTTTSRPTTTTTTTPPSTTTTTSPPTTTTTTTPPSTTTTTSSPTTTTTTLPSTTTTTSPPTTTTTTPPGSGPGNPPQDDRGDLFSPRNVALMMLAVAAISLLVQLTRGP